MYSSTMAGQGVVDTGCRPRGAGRRCRRSRGSRAWPGAPGSGRARGRRRTASMSHHLGQILVVPHLAIFWISWEVRKPSKKLRKGTRPLMAARWATAPRSMTSCGLDSAQHGKAGLAAGHDVGVVAEDVQRVGGHGTGGHVEHGRAAARRRSCTCWGSSAAGPGRRCRWWSARRRPESREPCRPRRPRTASRTTFTVVPKMFLRPWAAQLVDDSRPWGWTGVIG